MRKKTGKTNKTARLCVEMNETRTEQQRRISETTTGFFFLTGQNGSFFLFFRECNPSFHNSAERRESGKQLCV